jgi:hypothetical protein
MIARNILEETAEVMAARRAAYGSAAAIMSAIAARWSLTLGMPITAAQVTLCMIDLKLARLVHDPTYRDGVIDVIGYAALLPEVLASMDTFADPSHGPPV